MDKVSSFAMLSSKLCFCAVLACFAPAASAAESISGREKWPKWPIDAEAQATSDSLEIQSSVGGALDPAIVTELLQKRMTAVQTRLLQDAFESEAGLVKTLPVNDLLRATSAFVVPGGSLGSKGQLLLYSMTRAGLTVGLAGALSGAPHAKTCAAVANDLPGILDVTYEALARSAIGNGLGFPEAEGNVPAECQAFAKMIIAIVEAIASRESAIREFDPAKLKAALNGQLADEDLGLLTSSIGVIYRLATQGPLTRGDVVALADAIATRVEAEEFQPLAKQLLLTLLRAAPKALIQKEAESIIDAAQIAAQVGLAYADFTADGPYIRATVGAGYYYSGARDDGRAFDPVFYEELGVGYRFRASEALMVGPYVAASGLLFSVTKAESVEDAVWLGVGFGLNIYELVEIGAFGGVETRLGGAEGGKRTSFFVVGAQLPLADYLEAASAPLAEEE